VTKRFERAHRKGIKFTERDRQTVMAVYEARYLTNQDVGRLFYRPTTQAHCRQRLRYLFDKGYLRKRVAYPNEPDIYFLGVRGRNFVAKELDMDTEDVNKVRGVSGGRAPLPMYFMRHELTLSRLYVEARLECRLWGWEMQWRNARMLQLEDLGVRPDAWIKVSHQARSRSAYIEFTNEVPPASEIDKRIGQYVGLWERRGVSTPVLWFAPSAAKANTIGHRIIRNRYREHFLVSLIEDKRQFLTRPIWWWCKSEEPISFIKPPGQLAFEGRGGRR
jgi:hypothetical protein